MATSAPKKNEARHRIQHTSAPKRTSGYIHNNVMQTFKKMIIYCHLVSNSASHKIK